jgi:two-component system response regulator HydG
VLEVARKGCSYIGWDFRPVFKTTDSPLGTRAMTRILVADDEASFCKIIETFLEDREFEVRTANRAEAALVLLTDFQPDIILMDVRMPETSGLELLPQIKVTSPHSRVIVITGVDDYRVADLLYEAGADGYLTKPIRLNTLLATIRRFDRSLPATG